MDAIVSSFSKNFKSKITDFLTKYTFALTLYAAMTGFIKRTRKLTAKDTILMMIFASFRSKPSSLVDMTGILKSLNPALDITPQSLQERINSPECCEFVKAILEEIMYDKITEKIDFSKHQPTLLKLFKRVLLEDSSKIELSDRLQEHFKGNGGSASKSALKMNAVYDLANKKFVHLSEHHGTTSDQTLGTTTLEILQEGDLLLRDLGYLKVANLKKIEAVHAFFLSRLSGTIAIYLTTKEGTPIPFALLFKKYSQDGRLDLDVYIGKERHLVRLVAFRVPEEVANKRRRSLHKNAKHQGRTTATENLLRQDFAIFITNVDRKTWPAEVIPTIYRIRWQIELIFKSFKSQLKIHVIVGENKNRIRTLLYSKWIAVIICQRIYQFVDYYAREVDGKEASFCKVVNLLLLLDNFMKIVLNGFTNKTMKMFLHSVDRCCCKDKRRKRKSTIQRIEDSEISYAENNLTKKLVA